MAVNSPASNQSTFAPDLKIRVKEVAQRLRNIGAKDGARRIEMVEQQLQYFTVEGAFQYIQKEEILDEAEMQGSLWMHVLHTVRNLLSVAPIAFTWWALNLAATAYDKDLGDPRYHDDLYQPFLRLWQDGFHGNHGFVIPFSGAAGMDALILTGLILLVVGIPWYEKGRRKAIRDLLGDFDGVIDDLLAAIGKDGANSHLAQSDVNKITEAIKTELQAVILNYDRVAIETRELIQDTHDKTTDILGYTHEKTKEVFDDFKKDLAVYNNDIHLLTGGLKKMDTNLGTYGQKLTELTDASNKLAGSSNDLALNAKSMAESATLSSQASQGISNQLGALNTTQQEIVQTQKNVVQEFASAQKDVIQELTTTQKQVVQDVTTSQQTVVQKIADSQQEVVKQLTEAGDKVAKSGENTRDAAKELDRVASGLEQLARQDFQNMTAGMTQANQTLDNDVRKTASEIQQVASSLNGVNAQLVQSAQQLQVTTQAFTQALNAAAQTLATVSSAQQPKHRSWLSKLMGA